MTATTGAKYLVGRLVDITNTSSCQRSSLHVDATAAADSDHVGPEHNQSKALFKT